jgi:hypothetical protein
MVARKNFCRETPESVKSAVPTALVTIEAALQLDKLVEVWME